MAVFLIVPTSHEAALAAAITAKLPGKYHMLPKGEYLASFVGTSKELSDLLGVTDGTGGLAVIASISGYNGRAPNDIWEWITQNWKS